MDVADCSADTEGEYDRLFDTDCGHDVEDCKRECMGSIGDDGWCKAIVSCEVLIDMIYA